MIAGNEILEAAGVLVESRAIAPELHEKLRQSRMLRRQLRVKTYHAQLTTRRLARMRKVAKTLDRHRATKARIEAADKKLHALNTAVVVLGGILRS